MNSNTLPDHGRRALALLTAVGLGWAVSCGALLVSSPASAGGPEPDPMLRISVDNGRTTVDVGDTVDYTISLENLGADKLTGLRVSQTMPEGLTFGSADRSGAAGKDMVVWTVDLKPTSTLTLHTTMDVGATPDEVLRMATVACASMSAKKAPIVCATHSDELPAGAQAAAEDAASEAAGDDDESGVGTAVTAGAAVALILVVGSAVVVRRRRRDSHSPRPV